MFDMEELRKITLVGGPHSGKMVQIASTDADIWVYMNMYGVARSVRVGGMPRSNSMAAYRVDGTGTTAGFLEGE